MTGWGWAYMPFLSITGVVAVVVVTWAVVTVLRSGASSPDRGDASAARDILDERLAKGECGQVFHLHFTAHAVFANGGSAGLVGGPFEDYQKCSLN